MYENSSVAEDQPRVQNVEKQAVASGEMDSGSEERECALTRSWS
jgi:hypothetical protein